MPSAFVRSEEPAPAAEAPGSENLDVTITGEAKEEIQISKEPPPMEIAFTDVIGISREGQTDRVLADPVKHMSTQDTMGLIGMRSLQTAAPLSVRIPKPPFFQMEVAPGLSSFLWELQIMDQEGDLVKSLEGTSLPRNIVEWDGFEAGELKVKVGPAYTPILIVTDERGGKQRFFGDPVQLDSIQYEQDDLLRLEFNNQKLFERGSARFASDARPMLEAALDIMRQHVGSPFRVTVYDAAGALTQKRLEAWRKLLQERLMIEAKEVTLASGPAKERGLVTEILMLGKR